MAVYTPVSVIPVEVEVVARGWGEEVFITKSDQYLGKLLRYRAGEGGNLQMHMRKDETMYLYEGSGVLTYDRGDGTLVEVPMMAGQSVHIPPGSAHKFIATTDCIAFECGNVVFDDRVRLERYFGLPEPAGLPSTAEEPTR